MVPLNGSEISAFGTRLAERVGLTAGLDLTAPIEERDGLPSLLGLPLRCSGLLDLSVRNDCSYNISNITACQLRRRANEGRVKYFFNPIG
jgi:hypothetical protein